MQTHKETKKGNNFGRKNLRVFIGGGGGSNYAQIQLTKEEIIAII